MITMKRILSRRCVFGILAIIVFSSFISLVSATTMIRNDNVKLVIDIKDAYYCDADNDLVEDDVIMEFVIGITKYEDSDLVEFSLVTGLILPSGTEYQYYYEIETTKDRLYCTMYFFNHATESGWYTGKVTGILNDDDYVCGTDSIIFDPPEEREGTDPIGELVVE